LEIRFLIKKYDKVNWNFNWTLSKIVNLFVAVFLQRYLCTNEI